MIECAALLLRRHGDGRVPTTVCALTWYPADSGTVSVIGPTSVAAVSEAGAAVKAAVMPPALDLNEATAERRSTAVISPASVRAVTRPASEFRVIEPARVATVTATPRGTWTW